LWRGLRGDRRLTAVVRSTDLPGGSTHMSDLITTAQDTLRNECIEAFVGLQSFARSLAERAREQRGQTAAEYMGILFIISALIVAVVIAAVVKSGIAGTIGHRIGELVDSIGGSG